MSYIEAVEQCIKELIQRFEQNPNLFTSESDVKCYLYHLLISKDTLQESFVTKDKKRTNLIHTEYPTLLRPLVDLVVLDPKNITKYALQRQRVMCTIEIKFWSTPHFDEEQKKLRKSLVDENQAYKFFIYLLKKPSGWQDFREELAKNKEKNEHFFLESATNQAIVTKINPELSQ